MRRCPRGLRAPARVTGRIVQITARDAHEIESILAVLRTGGCQPQDLEIGRPDLESVFLDIMRDPTRTDSARAAAP